MESLFSTLMELTILNKLKNGTQFLTQSKPVKPLKESYSLKVMLGANGFSVKFWYEWNIK